MGFPSRRIRWRTGSLPLNLRGRVPGELARPQEVLVRAGLVRTFVQVPEVERVTLLIDGDPLKDSKGREIGTMTADSFLENSGREIYPVSVCDADTVFCKMEAGDHLVERDAAGAVQHEHSAGTCRGGAADEGTERRRPLCSAAGYDECLKCHDIRSDCLCEF